MDEPYIMGSVVFFLIIGGVLTLVIGYSLVKLYRRSISKYMQRTAGDGESLIQGIPTDPLAMLSAPRPRLDFSIDCIENTRGSSFTTSHIFHSTESASLKAAAIYAIAGLTHAEVVWF